VRQFALRVDDTKNYGIISFAAATQSGAKL